MTYKILEKSDGLTPKILFRIENPTTKAGMWYNAKGEPDPFIAGLTDGISAGLPMGQHERYGQLGRRWFSATDSITQLRNWFSTLDIKELYEAGYRLYRFTVMEYQVEEYQTLLTRESITECVEVPIGEVQTLFNIEF